MRISSTLLAVAAVCSLSVPAGAAEKRAYHLFVPGQVAAPRADQIQTRELYFGGPVMSQVNIVSVLWGSGVNAGISQNAPAFLGAVANSSFIGLLRQYSTDRTGVTGHPGTKQTIRRGLYRTQIEITPSDTSSVVTDSAIHKELLLQIARGRLPAQTPNTLYVIFFPANVTITLGGGNSCSAFGAYHEAVYSTAKTNNVYYAVIPDCGGGFGAELTFATSHEIAESVTDPIPTPGSHPAYPQAWNTYNGYEVGDLCEGAPATTLTAGGTRYTVTNVWDDLTKACSTGPFTSP